MPLARNTILAALAWLAACCGSPPAAIVPPAGGRHVQLLHLDGYRPDLVRTLLRAGRLPNLARLVARGRIAYDATTVDKSETMKVIQSYLTSQLDTKVVGWWQFERNRFRFSNYWLDPAEVLGYALGFEFPRSPTIQDFLAARGENLVAGMSLARRSVPFQNYGRAYVEGVSAVANHTYHDQAHATMDSFLDIHRRITENGEKPPAMSTLLLAAADEFSHLEGVTVAERDPEHCFDRDSDNDNGNGIDDTVFALLDKDHTLDDRYFLRVRRAAITRRVTEICIELPEIEGRRAEPHYVLSMLVIDIELGRLINDFENIHFADGETLFSRTLFIVFGDHGMVDTSNRMTEEVSESFIGYLNRRLGLETGEDQTSLSARAELGIDYVNLPPRLTRPDTYEDWQSEDVRALTTEADRWAREFLGEIEALIRSDLHESYWWLFFLRSLLIDPKLDEALESAAPVVGEALAMLRSLYLRARPDYLEAEQEANRALFDRHVRLVYGGGARNNAELFIPVCESPAACSWERRPSYEEILSYREGAFLQALVESPGVGLIFIKKNNEAFTDGAPLPARLEVEIRDREGNRGLLSVERDDPSGELVYHYRTDPASANDPLGYGTWGAGEGTYGTYNEWNDRTIDLSYVNVVGGMGAYLYSSNPAIGDVVVLHASDWNFGENLGGHGGVHRGEKRTFMLVSGPGLDPGELRAQARYRSTAEGGLEPVVSGTHVPTLLDIVPTALAWLGYEPSELDRFAADGFEEHLDTWIRAQRGDILKNLDGVSSLEKAREEVGVPELTLEPLRPQLERLLEFIESNREDTLRRLSERPHLGNELILE